MLKTILLPPSMYLLTYFQTLEEITWLLRQEKLNKRQNFQKTSNRKIYQKISDPSVKSRRYLPLRYTRDVLASITVPIILATDLISECAQLKSLKTSKSQA